MCTYNGERYLQQQLDSFLDQSRRPDELVICDDASSDATPAILEGFIARAPFPVRIVRNESNLGSTRNFVQAISLCTGDLIALSDQDDLWRRDKLRLQEAALEDATVGGVFSDGELIDEQSKPADQFLWASMGFTPAMQMQVQQGRPFDVLKKQYFVTGATLMFRSTMRSHFGDVPADWIHDAWMTWKLAIHSKLAALPVSLIGYRIHANNQVGVGTKDAAELLKKRTPKQMLELMRKECRQLQALRDEIGVTTTDRTKEAVQIIDQRMKYLGVRAAAISQARAMRPFYVLAALPQYMEFGKGWRSVLGDLAL